MSPDDPNSTPPAADPEIARRLDRRHFLAAGASMGAALAAGCSSNTAPDGEIAESTDGSGTTSTATPGRSSANVGTFRLLISDQPVAIDEFDKLDVSFDRARIFHGPGDEDDAEADETETVTGSETQTELNTGNQTKTETETVVETEAEETEADAAEENNDGFFVLDLGGATVDLTQVVGEKAMGVFDGELAEGRYTKIELHVERVEGIVAGDRVDVKVPSNKLQIVKPFEVVAGETLTFVFDINVVKKGQSGGYNLLPVIAKSGVAGQDVEVEEVPQGEAESAAGEETEEEEAEDQETEEDERGESEDDQDQDDNEGDGPPDEGEGNP